MSTIDQNVADSARPAMARLAAAIRGTAAVVAVLVAAIGLAAPMSLVWWVPGLLALVVWTGVYVWITWRRGVFVWLVIGDGAMSSMLCLAIGKLVPHQALSGGSSWVAVVASTVVICAQFVGVPVVSVPAGLTVAACFVLGSRLAGAPDNGMTHGITIATQTVVTAAVVVVALRTGRTAGRVFAELQATRQAIEIDRARRADQLTQLRLLHNGVLTTLTMAIHASGPRGTEVLRRHAAVDLAELPRLASEADVAAPALLRLDERLRQVVADYEPALHVVATLLSCSAPAAVVDAFADATAESLENVRRHARQAEAVVELDEQRGDVRVTVRDDGIGFDPVDVPAHRFGLRQAIVGRMTAVGGSASIHSEPGRGTTVCLAWRRG